MYNFLLLTLFPLIYPLLGYIINNSSPVCHIKDEDKNITSIHFTKSFDLEARKCCKLCKETPGCFRWYYINSTQEEKCWFGKDIGPFTASSSAKRDLIYSNGTYSMSCDIYHPAGKPNFIQCCSLWGYWGTIEESCDVLTKSQFGCWGLLDLNSSNDRCPIEMSKDVFENGSEKESNSNFLHFDYAHFDATPFDSSNVAIPIHEENPFFDPRGLFSSCAIKGVVSLTYDDGPSEYTETILDELKKHNITATFFLLGKNINSEERIRIIKRIYNEGHIVGSHTVIHYDLTKLTKLEIVRQMNTVSDTIKSILGIRPVYMRPPYGGFNENVKKTLFKLGYKIFMWNLDACDPLYNKTAPNKIFGEFQKHLTKFQNVRDFKSWIPLQHDVVYETAKQQPAIIKFIKEMGYRFVSLNECIGDKMPIYKLN